jgi:hypothetical protein
MERKRETFFGKIHEKKQPKEGLSPRQESGWLRACRVWQSVVQGR